MQQSDRPTRVLITRPETDSEELARLLAARGVEPVSAPLMDIVWHEEAAPALDGVQALLFTSANGVRAFARASGRRDLPALCVGDATAQKATEAGFADTRSAAGDVTALAALVRRTLSPDAGRLLHVAGSAVAGDLAGELEAAGFSVERAVLYEARPVGRIPAVAAGGLDEGTLPYVLFFSPRTASAFASLVEAGGLAAECRRVEAVCLSPAVAAAAAVLDWRRIHVAAAPTQAALLECLEQRLREDVPTVSEDQTSSGNRPDPSAGFDPAALDSLDADTIVAAFGGIRPMATKLGVPVTTVQGWKNRNRIPENRYGDIAAAASRHGVALPLYGEGAGEREPEKLPGGEYEPKPEEEAKPQDMAKPESSDGVKPDPEKEPDPGEKSDPGKDSGAGPWATPQPDPESNREPDTLAETTPEDDPAEMEAIPEPDPASGPPPAAAGAGSGLAVVALLLALVALAAAVTAPFWRDAAFDLVGISPPVAERPAVPDPDVAALRQEINSLRNAVDGMRTQGGDSAALSQKVQELEARLAEVSDLARQAGNGGGAGNGTVDGAGLETLSERVTALESGLREDMAALRKNLDSAAATAETAVGSIEDIVGQTVGPLQSQVESLSGRVESLSSKAEERAGQLDKLEARNETQADQAAAVALLANHIRTSVLLGQPFAQPLQRLRAVAPDALDLGASLAPLEGHAETGVVSRAVLRDGFRRHVGDFQRAARDTVTGDAGAGSPGWLRDVIADVSSVVSIRRVSPGAEGKQSPLTRAETQMEKGMLAEAVATLEEAVDETRLSEAAAAWLDQARAHVDAIAALDAVDEKVIAALTGNGAGNGPPGNVQSGNVQSGSGTSNSGTPDSGAAGGAQ